MKPHPKLRKTIKWGGLAVTVLLVVVWVGSGWWSVEWGNELGDGIGISGGSVLWAESRRIDPWQTSGFSSHRRAFDKGLHFSFLEVPFDLKLAWGPGNGWARWVSIPAWLVTAMTLLASLLAWRLDTLARRRARIGRCPKCNYDRTGLAIGAKCPECGSVPASEAS